MEPRERIIRAFSDGDGERPPAAIFTQSATVSQMDRCGAAWPEANYRADLMARLALESSMSFGFPTVRVPFSITAEAQSLGCGIRDCGKSSQPMVVGSPYRDSGAVPDVPDMPSPEEFAASPLIRLAPEALRLAGRERPDLFSVSGVAGPVSVVGLLLGIENLVMGTMSDMPLIGRWISAVQPLITAEAKLCAEAADCVQVTDGLASPDILPPASDIFVPEMLQDAAYLRGLHGDRRQNGPHRRRRDIDRCADRYRNGGQGGGGKDGPHRGRRARQPAVHRDTGRSEG